MPTCAITIGGPGAGKTTRALQLMAKVLATLVRDPLRIGFVSFTRSARREAAARAANQFNLPITDLEKHGWFRTLHSCCYQILGVQKGELLTGAKDDLEWLRNTIGDDHVRLASSNEDDDSFTFAVAHDAASLALNLWDVARNMLEPIESLWEKRSAIDDHLPSLDVCEAVVKAYEDGKRKDGRLDFCDLLMRVAGKQWNGDGGFMDADPDGQVPLLPVWFLDEAQDISLLTSLVFKRMIQPSTWVYLMGDDWQSIYGWCGADGSLFANWTAAKKEILPLSYRCGQNILDLGAHIMQGSHGYEARDFKAKNANGEIHTADVDEALDSVKPGEDTLILSRTNEYARRVALSLDDRMIPWKPTKGSGGYNAPARIAGVSCLVKLAKGDSVDGRDIHAMLELLPSRIDGKDLFTRGTKAWFKEAENQKNLFPGTLADSCEWGGTELFKTLVASGKYKELLETPAAKAAMAGEIHGIDAIKSPTVRVGTCHSAKGGEADHVVCVNRIPYPTERACETQEGMDEERRVWYTTVTRAKKKLTIAEMDEGTAFPEL